MSLKLEFGDINPLTLLSSSTDILTQQQPVTTTSPSSVKINMSEMDLNAISKIISDECLSEQFIHQCGLLPLLNSSTKYGQQRNDVIDLLNKSLNNREGRSPSTKLIKHKFWGICRDLQFNPNKPLCEGSVTTKFVRSKKFTDTKLAKYRCTKCYKEISQKKHLPNVTIEDIENSLNNTVNLTTRASSVSSSGSSINGLPPSIFARELVFFLWAFSEKMGSKTVKQVAEFMFPNMLKHTIDSWYEFLRSKMKITHEKADSKIGGIGQIVQLEVVPFNIITTEDEEVFNVLTESFVVTKENIESLKNLGIIKERGAVVALYYESTEQLRYRYIKDADSKEELFEVLRQEVVPETILSSKLDRYFNNDALATDDRGIFVFYNLKENDNILNASIKSHISTLEKQIIDINVGIHDCSVIESEKNEFIDSYLITNAWFANQSRLSNPNYFINFLNQLKVAVN
uniref:SF4 helicase domain-containing protein n=1 Tax=Parastrongyloides trichosuri TaxID=131310 RepID=A0A0N4ZK67_PARTI